MKLKVRLGQLGLHERLMKQLAIRKVDGQVIIQRNELILRIIKALNTGDITYNGITYNGITYNDITYNDITYKITYNDIT